MATSIEDQERAEDLPPPALAGWRYTDGAWLRWSELEGDYRPAPIPYTLVAYGNSIGTPREGLTVAMVDGAWREVASGVAPILEQYDDDEETTGRTLPTGAHGATYPVAEAGGSTGSATTPADGASSSPPVSRADQPPPVAPPGVPGPAEVAPVDPARQRAEAEAAMAAQMDAWRRRNRF